MPAVDIRRSDVQGAAQEKQVDLRSFRRGWPLFDLTRCYDACSETLLVVAVTTMIKTRSLLSHAELKLDRHDRLKRAESVGKTRACAEALGSGNLITCGFCRLKQNRCNHSNRTKAIVGPRHTFPVTPGLLQTRFIQQTTLRMQE